MNPFRSIKGKLLLFALSISLIPIVTITTVYFLNAKSTLSYQILEKLRAIAESREQLILSAMEKIQMQTAAFSSDGFIRNNFKNIVSGEISKRHKVTQLNRYLIKNKLPLHPHLMAIILVDMQGKVISSTNEKFIGKDFSNQATFKNGVSKKYGEPYIDQPSYSSCLDLSFLSISAPIVSVQSAEVLGVIINAYNLAILNDITSNRVGMGETGEVYLVNKDKIMITESRFKEGTSFKQIVDTEPVRRVIEGNEEMVGIYTDYRGMPVVGVSMNVSKYNWVLLVETDIAETFAPLKLLGAIVFVLGLVSAAAVVGTGVTVAISISKPINNLTNAVKRFAKGDLDYRVEVIGKDEIGELSGNFNIMANELAREITERKRVEDELKKFNKILEQRVAERTAVLKKVNEELQTEITERKQAEEMLQRSKDSLANAQRIAHLGSCEWDIVENKVIGSDEFYRIFGLMPQISQEFAGTYESFLNFVHPDDKELVEKTIHEALYERKPFIIDSRIVLKNGSERIIHAQAEVVFDDTGKAIQMSGIAQDITDIKRLEDELRKISNAVEQSSSLIIITDIKGNIEYINPKFTQVTGYTLEEVIGKNPHILKSGQVSPEEYKRLWTTITSGDEWRGEFINKKKNGELYWELASISPVKNSKGVITHFIAVKEDITERKQMEEELRLLNKSLEQRVIERTKGLKKVCEELQLEIIEREKIENTLRKSEASLANAQRIAHLGNWEWNIVKNELWWSDEIYRIFGLIPQTFDVTYQAFLDSVHPDDRGFVKRSVNEALYERKPYRMDHRIVLPDGVVHVVHEEAEVIFDDTGRAIQMNGTVHDITERKQAEESLRKSESKYRLLFESLPQQIFYKDKDSVYISCNENFARGLHIRPDEIIGKTDYDLFPKRLADKYRTDDKTVIEIGQTKDREEEYVKDGQELIVHSIKTPIRDEKGRVIGILGILWDITEKVTLQMDAVRNRHLAALGELAAGVGHEINNPMTGVINCAQIIINKSKEGSKERDLADRIIKEGNRVVNIVHSLLSFARSGDGKKGIVHTREILSDVFILMEAQLQKEGIKVKMNVSPDLPKILVNQQQIQRAFLNIISNARYALNQKYPDTHDNKILEILSEVTTMNNQPYVKITFYDRGIGIPDIQEVFFLKQRK